MRSCRVVCRLFASSGRVPDLARYLVGEGSLEALACEHGSGWGLAAWADGRPVVRKEPVAADDPKSGWRDAARAVADAPLVLAHLRKASIGRVSVENTHPFAFGAWSFAHNGTVYGLDAGRDALLAGLDADVRGNVRGTTDSELAAHLFLQRLRDGPAGLAPTPEHAADALAATATMIRRAFPGDPLHPSKTTFLAGNGAWVVGHRRGKELAYYQGDGHAVVASQPIGPHPEAWRAVPDGASLVLKDGRVHLTRVGTLMPDPGVPSACDLSSS